MPLAAAAAAALQLAPLAAGLFHRKKKGPNRNAILARYRASKPAGYTTGEDAAAAERTRGTISGAAEGAAQRQRVQNSRQVTARGLAGPAAAALERDASGIAAAGSEEAARTSADQLYRAFNSNLGYARSQNDTAFGAELGLATQEAQQGQAQDATFWNSMLEAIPAVATGLAPRPAATSTAPTAVTGAPAESTAPTAAYGAPAATATYRRTASPALAQAYIRRQQPAR